MGFDDEPRLVADKMLGRLARWLRLLGCDVLYGQNFSGKGLLAEARRGKRMILTRDRRLVRDPDAPPFLLVEHDRVRDQLRQVVGTLGIDPYARLFRRCVECNGDVEEVEPREVAGRVPEFVLATRPVFRRCTRCGRVYWEGTHVARVREELRRMGFEAPAAPGAV